MAAQAPPKKFEPKTQPSATKSPIETRGHVSAQGVFAELETIEPTLRKHQQETAQKLAQTLTEKVKTVLPTFARTRFDDATLTKIASEVAQESAYDILENIPKIQDFAQAPQVVADSLTQSIVAHPDLENQLKKSGEKIFTKLIEQTQDVVTTHQQDLSKAAVLGQIVNITKLEKPNEHVRSLVISTVDQVVQAQHPLAPPEVNQTLYGNTAGFVQTYIGNFKQQISPQLAGGNIPNFVAFQQAKSAAFEKSTAEFGKNVAPKGGINPTDISARISFILGLDPQQTAITRVTAPIKTGRLNRFALKASLASSRGQTEFYKAALSHDREWLEKNLKETSQQVEDFKNQKSLSYKNRKAYRLALQKLQGLQGTLAYSNQNSRRAQNWLALVRALPSAATGQNDIWANHAATYTQLAAFGQLPGVFAPASLAGNQVFLARNTLSLLSPRFGLGDLWGNLKGSFMSPTKLGMGKTLIAKGVGMMVAGGAMQVMKDIAKGSAAVFGGLALYFLALGKAAMVGFMVGAAVGGTAGFITGAVLGFQVGVTLAPFTFGLSIPICTALGAIGGGFLGATVFGVAGGLIALGLASGTTTAVTMGAGAAVGGVVGTYAGAVIGASAGTAIGTGLAFITGGLATPLIPVFTAMGAFTGAAIGAVVGTFVGAAVGYLIGHYVLPVFKGAFDVVGSLFTGGANAGVGTLGAIGGLFGSIGSFFTGLAAGVWGGITGAAGAGFGFLSGAANFIVGGLSSLTIPTSMVAIPVAGGLGAVVIGGTIVGIVTATSFFNSEGEILSLPGENQYAKVEKKVTATDLNRGPSTFIFLENTDLPEPLKFDVSVTAKTDLTNITCSDEATRTNQGSSRTNLLVPTPSCPSTMAANEPFELPPFEIQAVSPEFNDSLVVNIFTFRANNPDNTPIVLSMSASVAIGDAPLSCPRDWPTRFGHISQGPQALTSHNDMHLSRGEEAIDIGDGPGGESINGVDALATFEGNVIYVENSDPGARTFGAQIQVQGTCEGVTFTARWAHLKINSIPFDLTDPMANRHVTPGIVLGKIDDTGESGGPHLHYSFLGGLIMQPPNIPDTISDPTCEDGPNTCPISWSL